MFLDFSSNHRHRKTLLMRFNSICTWNPWLYILFFQQNNNKNMYNFYENLFRRKSRSCYCISFPEEDAIRNHLSHLKIIVKDKNPFFLLLLLFSGFYFLINSNYFYLNVYFYCGFAAPWVLAVHFNIQLNSIYIYLFVSIIRRAMWYSHIFLRAGFWLRGQSKSGQSRAENAPAQQCRRWQQSQIQIQINGFPFPYLPYRASSHQLSERTTNYLETSKNIKFVQYIIFIRFHSIWSC